MYNFKEKKRLLSELLKTEFAQKDLALLLRLSPSHRLRTLSLPPERKAEEILYDLLDHATREEIVANRKGEKKTDELANKDLIDALDETRNELEETRDELEQTQEELEEAQEKLEDLEDEKKNPKNRQRKRSIQTSPGISSKIKMYKRPR